MAVQEERADKMLSIVKSSRYELQQKFGASMSATVRSDGVTGTRRKSSIDGTRSSVMLI
jgi:hypothetical protein